MKNERGLTLVELLAVIVILGIISTIAFVSIGKIINNSKADAHLANARQVLSIGKLAHASGHEPEHPFDVVKSYKVSDFVEWGLLGDDIKNPTDIIQTPEDDKVWNNIKESYNLEESIVVVDNRNGKHVYRVNLSIGGGNFIFDNPKPIHEITRDAFTPELKRAFRIK